MSISAAEELIQQWLDPPIRVHAWGDDSPIVSHQEFLGLEMGADESSWRQRSDEPSRKDFLSDLDWSEGDVRENVRAVVDGLMQKSLAKVQSGGHGKRKSHDPRITMEMRHKEVLFQRWSCHVYWISMALECMHAGMCISFACISRRSMQIS